MRVLEEMIMREQAIAVPERTQAKAHFLGFYLVMDVLKKLHGVQDRNDCPRMDTVVGGVLEPLRRRRMNSRGW
jgi:hypothetical protein